MIVTYVLSEIRPSSRSNSSCNFEDVISIDDVLRDLQQLECAVNTFVISAACKVTGTANGTA